MAAPKKKKSDADEVLLPTEEEAKQYANEIFKALNHASMQGFLSRVQTLAQKAPQVILFEGGTAKTRMATAKHWAALLNCEDSAIKSAPCLSCASCLKIANEISQDFIVFNGLKESIKVEEMRELKPLVATKASELKNRIVLYYEAQAFTGSAANSILKLLEEPNNTTYFIFTVAHRELILPTLVSRANVLILPSFSYEDDEASLGSASNIEKAKEHELVNDLFMFLSQGKSWFGKHTSQKGYTKEEAFYAIHLLTLYLSKALSLQKDSQEHSTHALTLFLASKVDAKKSFTILNIIEEAQEALGFIVNPALVMDSMLIQIYILLQEQ